GGATGGGRARERRPPAGIAALMNREDRRAVAAVGRVRPQIAAAVELIVAALQKGGRLFFVGAGTSGRLGVLEAAECPPTFGTPSRLVQAIIAGGRGSVFRSRGGAGGDGAAPRTVVRAPGRRRAAARSVVRARVRRGDVFVGVSASGVTPFVTTALTVARRQGAATVLVACNAEGAHGSRSATNLSVVPVTGPEVLAGSTRLKAGTA